MSDDIRELTERDFARILRGQLVGLAQQQVADALGTSVHTLRNWEQSRRSPAGPALALLRIAAPERVNDFGTLTEKYGATGWRSPLTREPADVP